MASAKQVDRLAEKTAFFRELALLEGEDDATLDKGLQGSMHALSRQVSLKSRSTASPGTIARDFALETPMSTSSPKMLGTTVSQTPVDPLRKSLARTLLRSNTVPEKAVAAPSTPIASVEIVKDTPIRSPISAAQVPQLRYSLSTPVPVKPVAMSTSATASMSKATGKRKRIDTVKQVSEELRVFSGLNFFFVPNDDIAAARRLRIRKAIEYGATRVTEWDSTVTHIIVDKALTYQDVLKYLRLPQLPDSVIMVGEAYPADCISYRTMIPHDQIQYRVQGSETAHSAMPPPPLRTSSSEATQRSLQIKAVRAKEDVVVQPRTPSRTDESSVEAFRQQVAEVTQDSVAMASMNPEKQRRKSSVEEGSDALEAVLEQAKAGADFGSDSEQDEQDAPRLAPEDIQDSDNNDDRPPPKSPRRLRKTSSTCSTSSRTGKQTYACMRGGSATSKDADTNPNARTIEILQQMATHYDSMRDTWRTRAYRQAISTLRAHPTKVTSAAEAALLPNISDRIAAKIEEIVWTNRLRRLESTKDEPADQALQLFAKIYGVGLAQASKWVQAGHRTLEDLTTRNVPLTENQKIGLAHFDDFNARIPRAEVAQHGEIVRRALLAIDPHFQATIGGSYRRGARDSGDIDIVITAPGATATYLRTVVLENLVPELFKQGFLRAGLATTDKDSGSKWHGASQLPIHISTGMLVNPYPWRRIDFLLVPWDEIGAAMIYFTGNDIFNRSMRLLARRKGMRLNQRGLYKDVIRGKDGTKLTEGIRMEGQDERRIFELLGVKWREATDRNC